MMQMMGYLLAAVAVFAVAVLVVAGANRLHSLTSFQVRAEFRKDSDGQDRPRLGDGS